MKAERSLLAIIPARAGSKGVRNKNLRPLAGKPLVAWTIEAARSSSRVDRVVVSTDSEAIAEAARAWGADVPFRRPKKYATDRAAVAGVVVHALKRLARDEGRTYDDFVVLQPTSPLRTAAHIDAAAAALCRRPDADALVSVVEARESPYWMKVIDNRGGLRPFLSGRRAYPRRQDLPRVYVLNGALYMGRSARFLDRPDFYAGTCLAFVMDRASSLDIDDADDFAYGEYLLARRG